MSNKINATYKDIIQIALPLVLGNLGHNLISVFDVVFMSRYGQTEQAAIGYISMISVLLILMGFSFSKGTQILIARESGAQNNKRIGLITDNANYILMSTAVIIVLVVLFSGKPLLRVLLKNEAILDSSYIYLRTRIFALPIDFWSVVMIAFFTGIGRTRIVMYGTFLLGFTNVVFNYLLIFGHAGFPEMGMKGAAWASNIASIIGALYLLSCSLQFKYRKRYALFGFSKADKDILRETTRLGLPLVAQTAIGFSAWIIFFSFIEKMGERALAVSNLIKVVYMLVCVPAFSLANATNTIIGNLSGQQKIDQIVPVIKKIMLLSLVVSLVAGIFPVIFTKAISIAITGDVSQAAESRASFISLFWVMFVFSLSVIVFNSVASIGRVKVLMIIEFISIFIYLVFCYFIFHSSYITLALAWTSEMLYWLTQGLLALLYLRFSNWKTKLTSEMSRHNKSTA